MAGHSKWANIKRRKAAQDAHKTKARTRMIREIIVSAQEGGIDNNPRLQLAVQNAKKANVPKNKIDEAIKRASGTNAENYEEILYEAYAPHGIALVIETMTDNVRRTVAAVRSMLTKYEGKLTSNNALAHLFSRKGVFTISTVNIEDTETLTFTLLEAGIDSLEEDEGQLYITCPLQEFSKVREALTQANITPEETSLQYLPTTTIPVSPDQAQRVEKLIEALENEDDVQRVYDNMTIEPEA